MHYSIKDITSSLPKKKNKGDSFWVQYLIRYVSYPFTYFFINLGWSANQVSILSWIVIFIGSLLLAINNNACMLAGVILINFWIVLDCVDGNIARTKKVKTFMGDFFDAIAGYGPFSFTTLALGVAAYNTTHLVNDEYRYLLLIVGGFGALINLYTRLIHQKYTNCFFAAKKILNELDDIVLKAPEKGVNKFAYFRMEVDKNVGVSGIFMPWLIVSYLTQTYEIMLGFYTLYYIVAFLGVSVLYSRKAEVFEKESQQKMIKENRQIKFQTN